MKILYINACIRKNSRTNNLAKYLLNKLDGEIIEIELQKENLKPLDLDFLNKRDELLLNKKYDDQIFKYANLFKNSDIVVISSPYYDLSFSSLLKIYLENINCVGITFKYDEFGKPVSLCNLKKLFYITTSGGNIVSDSYGFGYVKALTNMFYGIKDIKYIKAEGLDINPSLEEKILNDKKLEIDKMFEGEKI